MKPNICQKYWPSTGRATGQDREAIIRHFLTDAWVYQTGPYLPIEGFWLPALGEGLIVAENETAGIALLRKRNAANGPNPVIAIPDANLAAIRHLREAGYKGFRKIQLMHYGPMKDWRPEMIYNRIGGYLG